MNCYCRTIGVVLALVACARPANAQFFDKLSNPKITVMLHHPPGLGLKVSRIAFAQPTGDKADQITDALASDFVNAGMEVLDRQHLQSTLAEHQLNSSGYLNQQTTAQLGKLLGSTALLFVNVQRAATEQQQLRADKQDRNGRTYTDFISRTNAHLKVSIQTVDLTTGRTLQARVFEASPTLDATSSGQCCAAFPSEFDALDLAIHQVVGQAHRLFVSWTEPQQLYFFNDKECEMKSSFNLLKGGDVEGAHKLALASIDGCKADPKMDAKKIAHSLYNAGMSTFLLGDNETALDFLSQAQRSKDIDITTEAMVQVRRAQSLAADARRVDERTAQAAASSQPLMAPPPPPPPPPPAPVPPPATTAGAGTRGGRSTGAPKSAPGGVAPKAGATAPPAPKAATDAAKPKGTPAERLKSLNELFKQGLITQSEYDKKKAEILKEM